MNTCMLSPLIYFLILANKQLSKSQYSRLFSDLQHHHPEMPHEHAAAGVSGTPLPKRTARHQKRKKKMKAQKGSSRIEMPNHKYRPVSDDEIAHHVSSMYITGPGGFMKEAAIKREKQNDNEHLAFLKKLDRHPTLVLNADYQPLSVLPLSIWSWQETIKSLFSGRVVVVDVYPGLNVKAVNVDVPLPSVIALTEYNRQPNQIPAFTRRNVFLRDGYKCQYCSKTYRTGDLSLDHVTPRCVGGRLDWENAVTSCRKCNGRKGSILPQHLKQIGMKLLREPRVPTKWELAANAEKMVPKKVHSTWKPFLGMHMVPEDHKGAEETFFNEIDESF